MAVDEEQPVPAPSPKRQSAAKQDGAVATKNEREVPALERQRDVLGQPSSESGDPGGVRDVGSPLKSRDVRGHRDASG